MGMERVTLRVPSSQIDEIDAAVDAGEYPNRSEAIRAAIRRFNRDHAARRVVGADY